MGREIRRVPKGWVHPTDKEGKDLAMYDETYEEASKTWIEEFLAWTKGEHEYQTNTRMGSTCCEYYWDYAGPPPLPELHRPAFESEPVCFQIYQTVSEGTPTSPVFGTEEEMVQWLIEEGYSEKSARTFVDIGHAPSMLLVDGKLHENIHALDYTGADS